MNAQKILHHSISCHARSFMLEFMCLSILAEQTNNSSDTECHITHNHKKYSLLSGSTLLK